MTLKKTIASFLFHNVWGWKSLNTYPQHIKQSIILIMHHTSNWDFLVGVLGRATHSIDSRFVGKHTLFKEPLGTIMRFLGGYPIERSKNHNYVDAVAEIFSKEPNFKVGITPEGTRKKVEKIKTGFYYIANKAKVPIVMCSFDWATKTLAFSEPFMTTGDFKADIPKILDFFRNTKGKIPEWDFDIDKYLTQLSV